MSAALTCAHDFFLDNPMQNVYAVDLSSGEVRGVLATVPQEQGSNKDGLWRFNDCRAAPGGQIIAGRYASLCDSVRTLTPKVVRQSRRERDMAIRP